MSLSGCAIAPKPKPIIKTKYVYVTPPDILLSPCVAPPFVGKTWADLAADNAVLLGVIERCDLRFKEVRQYIKNSQSL